MTEIITIGFDEPIIRYYKGRVKCERVSNMSPLKTALYRSLEDGFLNPDRKISYGEPFIAPVRLCHKKRKADY